MTSGKGALSLNSIADVWKNVLDRLRSQLSETTINTWFDEVDVVTMEDSAFVLHCSNAFKKSTIEARFMSHIKAALKDIFSSDLEVKILDDQQLSAYHGVAPDRPGSLLESDAFTFGTYVVGPQNKMAYAAARAVAEKPAEHYNPLFIYGDSGLGKTHLLYAIAHQVRSRQTQEEFFHTFNTLYESGRQIVLTSDRPPREMTQLEDRLQTRFEWGLMVDVAPPDFETRLAIIKNKAALLGVQLPDDISSFIAENLTANVRQIEGALNKLLAYRDLLGNQVDGEAVSRAVKDMLKKYNEFVPSPGLIVEYICRYYDVDEEQVRGQGRKRDLMEARQTAMYLIRRMTNLSLNDIGKEFGDRDHTTVLHSLDQVEKKMRSDPAYAEKVKEITTNINNKK